MSAILRLTTGLKATIYFVTSKKNFRTNVVMPLIPMRLMTYVGNKEIKSKLRLFWILTVLESDIGNRSQRKGKAPCSNISIPFSFLYISSP
jgi:hypothetical protein